jgi:hypothetical protein
MSTTDRAIRKVTVHLPGDLLRDAQAATGKGITETIKRGLQSLATARAYQELRKMRGKVRFSINLKELREDRG